jgi:hypothetical protein
MVTPGRVCPKTNSSSSSEVVGAAGQGQVLVGVQEPQLAALLP